VNKIELFQTLNFRWREFSHFDENNWINLAKLGYRKYSEFDQPSGRWQIFLLEKKPEVELRDGCQPIRFFFAIFSGKNSNKQFPVSGIAEDLEELVSGLKLVSSIVFSKELQSRKKLLRFPQALNTENAQDYGYIRGLVAGIILMLIDIIPWSIGGFRPRGILNMFLDYTRILYYGTPGFAIIVGMAAIGIYFTVLFILIPIACGNLYVFRARKAFRKLAELLPDFLFECDFGRDAEQSLNDQYQKCIENVKKDETYRRALACWNNLKKQDFIELYEILTSGLCTAENLYDVLSRIAENCQTFDLKKFLKIMTNVSRGNMEIIIKMSDKQEEA